MSESATVPEGGRPAPVDSSDRVCNALSLDLRTDVDLATVIDTLTRAHQTLNGALSDTSS